MKEIVRNGKTEACHSLEIQDNISLANLKSAGGQPP